MEEVSTGAVVPAVVKPSPSPKRSPSPAVVASYAEKEADGGWGEEADKELLCPICMQMIKDAFLTACGHSFCYMCIVTHLRHKSDCPCCSQHLTIHNLFPNFLLDKVRFLRFKPLPIFF